MCSALLHAHHDVAVRRLYAVPVLIGGHSGAAVGDEDIGSGHVRAYAFVNRLARVSVGPAVDDPAAWIEVFHSLAHVAVLCHVAVSVGIGDAVVVGLHHVHGSGRLGHCGLHILPREGGAAVILRVAAVEEVELAVTELEHGGAVVLLRAVVSIGDGGRVRHFNLRKCREGGLGASCLCAVPYFTVDRDVAEAEIGVVPGAGEQSHLVGGTGLEALCDEAPVGYVPLDRRHIIPHGGVVLLHIKGIVVVGPAAVHQLTCRYQVQHFGKTLFAVGRRQVGHGEGGAVAAEMVGVEVGVDDIVKFTVAGPDHTVLDVVGDELAGPERRVFSRVPAAADAGVGGTAHGSGRVYGAGGIHEHLRAVRENQESTLARGGVDKMDIKHPFAPGGQGLPDLRPGCLAFVVLLCSGSRRGVRLLASGKQHRRG